MSWPNYKSLSCRQRSVGHWDGLHCSRVHDTLVRTRPTSLRVHVRFVWAPAMQKPCSFMFNGHLVLVKMPSMQVSRPLPNGSLTPAQFQQQAFALSLGRQVSVAKIHIIVCVCDRNIRTRIHQRQSTTTGLFQLVVVMWLFYGTPGDALPSKMERPTLAECRILDYSCPSFLLALVLSTIDRFAPSIATRSSSPFR